MRRIPIFATVLGLSLLAAPALARGPGGPSKAAAAHKGAHAKHAGQREARARQALKAAGVDEARINKVVETHKRFATERQAAREEMKKSRQALKALLDQNSTNESAYASALASMKASKKKMEAIRDREVAAVGQILKPSEQAKLLRSLHHAKRGKHAKQGKRGQKRGPSAG